uniref:Uncharacterized protein n=1 Tax=Arundo donax TaxID=35708 RepID=A0A0A8ZWI5_ARUDO
MVFQSSSVLWDSTPLLRSESSTTRLGGGGDGVGLQEMGAEEAASRTE